LGLPPPCKTPRAAPVNQIGGMQQAMVTRPTVSRYTAYGAKKQKAKAHANCCKTTTAVS
jgi:hypothetical protein